MGTNPTFSPLTPIPHSTQKLAEKNYRLWLVNPQLPPLQFKRLAGGGHRFSVRVGEHYRTIAWKLDDGGVVWVWIGTHAEHDRLLSQR